MLRFRVFGFSSASFSTLPLLVVLINVLEHLVLYSKLIPLFWQLNYTKVMFGTGNSYSS